MTVGIQSSFSNISVKKMESDNCQAIQSLKMDDKELKDAIKRQVEFYFSKQNLASDTYLVSQMGHQMYVPINVIVKFSKVKELTEDVGLVAEAIRESRICCLNPEETAIKPNIKSERNTIILREIPSATPEEKVRAIFDGCGSITGVRSDVGDTWFVTMETEKDAVNTLLNLKSKTFNGGPIKARLKSENMVKSFYPVASESSPVAASHFTQVPNYYATQGMGYYAVVPNFGVHPLNAQSQQRMIPGASSYMTSENNSRYGGRGNRTGRPGSHKQNNGLTTPKENRKATQNQGLNTEKGKKNKDKKNSKHEKKHSKQPLLNAANFPPLTVSADKKGDEDNSFMNTSLCSYSHDDIIEIVKNMSTEECLLESGKVDFNEHSIAFSSKANADLLKNQRTYSIEQAREALRHGRPIRSDSIGSVDYESMMYGEEYTKIARQARKEKSLNLPNNDEKAKVVAVEMAAVAQEKNQKLPEPQQEPQPTKGGYAAALLNGAPSTLVVNSQRSLKTGQSRNTPKDDEKDDISEKNNNAKTSKKSKSQGANVSKKQIVEGEKIGNQLDTLEVEVEANSAWGGRRTFLDVLKTKKDPAPEKLESISPLKSGAVKSQNAEGQSQ